ncbi:MAG: RidA family protein [Bacilli bacterium]
MDRKHYFTGSPWEPIVGYSRAIRVANSIQVAGTTAMKDGVVIGVNNPYEQTVFILETIKNAIENLGGSMNDVTRTRMFVTDISKWEEIGKAHGHFFKDIYPVATMVEVKALIDPLLLVEIEVEAIIRE